MTKWYEKDAMTCLDDINRDCRDMPACSCKNCVVIREELPAKKIERLLRGVILALDGMIRKELVCVSAHLRDLQELLGSCVCPSCTKSHHRTHILGHLARYVDALEKLRP